MLVQLGVSPSYCSVNAPKYDDPMDFPVGSTWAPGSKAFPWDGQGGTCFIFWMSKADHIFPL